MDSADTKKKDPKSGTVKRHKTRYPKVLYITALAGFVMATWILIHQKFPDDRNTQIPGAQLESVQPTIDDPSRFSMLLGRWQRPDGGYIIEIRGVNNDATLQAAYYNPQPIHVSQAYLTGQDTPAQIFIELTDVGYPGATYALTYDLHNDTLVGLYYQPSVEQRFEVVFIRIN